MTYFNPGYSNDDQAAETASRFAAPSQIAAKNSMAPMTWPWQQQQQAQPQAPIFAQGWTPPIPQQASPNALGQSPFSGNAFLGSSPMLDGTSPGPSAQMLSPSPWSLNNEQFQYQPQQQAAPVQQASSVQASQPPQPMRPPSPLDQIRQQMLSMKLQGGNMQPQEFASQMRALYNQSVAGR